MSTRRETHKAALAVAKVVSKKAFVDAVREDRNALLAAIAIERQKLELQRARLRAAGRLVAELSALDVGRRSSQGRRRAPPGYFPHRTP